MFNPTSPVAGGVPTGFTAPTYTLSQDTSPSLNSKQFAITATGGTQANVDVNSISKPFTISMFRPQQLNGAPTLVNGVVKGLKNNIFKIITRKGAIPVTGAVPSVILITTNISIPSGVDVAEPEEIKAAMALHSGVMFNNCAAICDSLQQGTI